ncbi:MAG: signal recognition particle-docking protein FtsY [Clostridiales bacterium]|nr:signal recognition particle-docking protein FtsY [Clostridiales bacterium]
MAGFFERLKNGIAATRNGIIRSVRRMVLSFNGIDDDLFDELEEILISGDVGVNTSMKIVSTVREEVISQNIKEPEGVVEIMKKVMVDILSSVSDGTVDVNTPCVITVMGVNGTGKTTTVGKLARKYTDEGKSVILAAADTFRAAAIDQLDQWAKRSSVRLIKHEEGSDPASVVFDAVSAGKAKGCDIVLCDTAGRLHNKKNLMAELEKIGRVVEKAYPGVNRETWLVIDASTGQNAVSQARLFNEAVPATGLIVTKLDGTAKGGMIFSIYDELKIPVKYVGVGEGIDDLQPFDSTAFVNALFEE